MADPTDFAPLAVQFGGGEHCDICGQDTSALAESKHVSRVELVLGNGVEGVTWIAELPNGAVGVKEDALDVVFFLTIRSVHRNKTTVRHSLQRRRRIPDRLRPSKLSSFLTADNELTAKLAEIYCSLFLALKERQKCRTKTDALLQSRKTLFASQHFCRVVLTGAHGAPDLGNSSAAGDGTCGTLGEAQATAPVGVPTAPPASLAG